MDAGTTREGQFTFDEIPAGTYQLTVIVSGFEMAMVRDVRVTAGRETVVNVTLRIAPAMAEVEVRAAENEMAVATRRVVSEAEQAAAANGGGCGGGSGGERARERRAGRRAHAARDGRRADEGDGGRGDGFGGVREPYESATELRGAGGGGDGYGAGRDHAGEPGR